MRLHASEITGSLNVSGSVTADKFIADFITDRSLEHGNGFWRNTNVVSKNFTVPTGEIWKSLTGVNVNTGVNVTVNGTWTLTNYFGEI